MRQANSTVKSQRAAGVRTALVLAVVALASFGGIILAQYSGSPKVGLGMLGLAFVGFLLAAMTRRRGR
jgi:hypothetical protein